MRRSDSNPGPPDGRPRCKPDNHAHLFSSPQPLDHIFVHFIGSKAGLYVSFRIRLYIVHTYSQICKCLVSNKQVLCRLLNSQMAMQIAEWSLVLCEVPFRFCIHVISRIFFSVDLATNSETTKHEFSRVF